jgi:hypothetical protein
MKLHLALAGLALISPLPMARMLPTEIVKEVFLERA